jgi:hypothetical protein
MSIKLYNVNNEEHFGNNVYLIHRPHVLSNPYTHIKDKKTKAMFVVKNREDAIAKYSDYFDTMYGKNILFTKTIDEIYEKYKKNEDILLGCYCYPNSCHGEIIIQKLKQKLIKEKFAEARKNKL